ncbi:MAG: dockerin type I domain-containing protein, partial [Planctomycetota bacterium]|nr:dockerin type I domain-containing protein [Planctomycetota bacterium]
YIGVLPNAVYSSATGYGWESPMMAQDRVQGPDDVRRDFQWGQFGKFQIEVTPNVSYKLQALFGEVIPGQWPPGPPVIGEGSNRDPEDPGTTATLITVTPEGGDPVTLYRPLVNNFQPIDFTGFSTDEVLEITISVSGGVYEYFAINALAIWQRDDAAPAKFQLLAADAPADQPLGAVLTQTALGPIVDEARARWVAFGLSADQSVTLQAMAYRVADLPSPALAEIDTTANSMLIDRDAVGRGWFIDPTPWEDSEYVLGQPPPGVDLLTVVMHEMGHALGYQDLYSSQFPQALMALQLMPEQARRAPTGPLVTGPKPSQPNDGNGDGHVTPTDGLRLINRIDASDGPLTTVAPDGSPMFYDVSADNFLSALDVLRVVNYLNTPAVAQLSAPVLDSPSSTGPLVVAPEIVPSAPAGSSPTAVGPPARATDQVVLPAAGTQSPVPVWPAAEGEDWLDDLAADVQAAQADELATDAIFQELGKI